MGQSVDAVFKYQKTSHRDENMDSTKSCIRALLSLSSSSTKEEDKGFRAIRGHTHFGYSFTESIEAGTEDSSYQSSDDNESPNTVMWASRPLRRSNKKSRPIPVRRRQAIDSDQEDVDEMTRLYDMRTWEMYLRITEARKKSASPASAASIGHHQIHRRPSHPQVSSATIQTSSSAEEHDDESYPELFFGDLDD